MLNRKKIPCFIGLFFGFSLFLSAQSNPYRIPFVSVPMLTIVPDSRGGAMGNVGVAGNPSIFDVYHNKAKLAFLSSNHDVALSFTPLLRYLTSDISASQAVWYKRISPLHHFSSGLTWQTSGNLIYRDDLGNSIGEFSPSDFAWDVGYTLKVNTSVSLAVSAKIIYSSASRTGQSGISSKAFATDVAFYYKADELALGETSLFWSWGVTAKNIGSKIKYNTVDFFLPAQFIYANGFLFKLDPFNSIQLNIDFMKYLVYTPPIYKTNPNGSILYENASPVIESGKDPNVSPLQMIFQSFYDAPGGFSEELQEVYTRLGLEYGFDEKFFLRIGTELQSKKKGGRNFFTAGTGIQYNRLGVDISYVIPLSPETGGPFANSIRVSLAYNLDRLQQKQKKEQELYDDF